MLRDFYVSCVVPEKIITFNIIFEEQETNSQFWKILLIKKEQLARNVDYYHQIEKTKNSQVSEVLFNWFNR